MKEQSIDTSDYSPYLKDKVYWWNLCPEVFPYMKLGLTKEEEKALDNDLMMKLWGPK